MAARSSLGGVYQIPSASMEPTLTPGDRVWVSHVAYDFKLPFMTTPLVHLREPRRGEVIVFEDPRDPSRYLIKRLAGLPGDRVQVFEGSPQAGGYRTVTVPPDHYYFLGDNRGNSADSRMWGFAHRNLLKGRARAVLWHWGPDAWAPRVEGKSL